MENKQRWCALYSQTGSELYEITKNIQRIPNIIITNSQKEFNSIHNLIGNIIGTHLDRTIYFFSKKPRIEDYRRVFRKFDLITLHGWLNIIPPEICNKFEIYNGHPGLISTFPQLKGFNPQERAYNLKLKESGSVIHRVTAEVDAGEILMEKKINIEGLSLKDIICKLHDTSINLWCDFLKEKL